MKALFFGIVVLMSLPSFAIEDAKGKKEDLPNTTLIDVQDMKASEKTIEGYTFPSSVMVDGKILVLNGVGLRKVNRFGLSFKVYFAGLYLEKKSSDPNEILENNGLKMLKSVYLRAVSTKDQKQPWRDFIKNSCKFDCKKSKAVTQKMIQKLVRTKKGGKFDITFFQDKVLIEIDGKKTQVRETYEGEGFAKDLLNAFIGDKPPTKALKNGLLGLK